MRPLVRTIRRNFGYKMLSLGIATLLYVISNSQMNPHVSGDVYIQPQVVGLPDDMVIKTEPAGGMVAVSGASATVSTFKEQSVKATVDVSRARVGLNRLPVTYKTLPGVDLMGQPRSAEVILERKSRKTYFVDVLTDDVQAPPGYEYGDAVSEPKEVRVSGLAADVSRVARVVAVVRSDQSGGSLVQQVDLSAQTSRQQTVDAVQIEPDRVQVRLSLHRAAASKAVLLSAALDGSPTPGFVVTGYVFQPATVTLSGPQNLLTARSSLPVSVSVAGIAASVTRTVTVTPPSGLTLRDAGEAQVCVRIEVQPISAPRPTIAPVTRPSALPSPRATPSLSLPVLPTPTTPRGGTPTPAPPPAGEATPPPL